MMRIVLAGILLGAVGGCGAGCGRDGGAPPLPAAAIPGGGHEAASGEPGAADSADPAAIARDLWFADGHGRAAILARERGDHATAITELDALLADASTSPADRAAGQLLRGLEDLRQDRWAEAAERFAAAAAAEAMQPLRVRLGVLEAQARLDAADPEAARAILAALDPDAIAASPVADDVLVIEGDARMRTDDRAGALASYRRHLAEHAGGDRHWEVRVKLARALAAGTTQAEHAEAVSHYEAVSSAAPLSDFGEEAARELPGLRKKAGVERSAAETREIERRHRLAEADAMLSRRRYDKAIRIADELLARKGLPAAEVCQALYLKGSAMFKQRDRAKARPVFEKADAACAKAGSAHLDTRVKSRYQAARGRYAEGKYAAAARAFEAVAKDHPEHSYADDAWILVGESWEEHGDPAAARKAYEAALAAEGDMRHEAHRRLLVMLLAGGEHEAALALCDEALAGKVHDPREEAKLHYFRGRALASLGRSDDACAAWRAALERAPLDYPGLLALTRLREVGPDALADALAVLGEAQKEAADPIELPKSPGARRAVMLARLGLGGMAREELGRADVDGWPAVLVLNQAGLFAEAQRTLANLGSRWRRGLPDDETRVRWEAAHPRPFGDIVAPGEREHGVPPLLTFAIMQTESRFDPDVVSWAGAKGLVQLMPATAAGLAKEAGVEIGDPGRLFDPAFNLDLGMRYLARLAARYGGDDAAVPLAAASYNAGAGAVDRWLAERGSWELDLFIESIPYDETRNYTQSVLGRWHAYRWLYGEGEPHERVPRLPLSTPAKALGKR